MSSRNPFKRTAESQQAANMHGKRSAYVLKTQEPTIKVGTFHLMAEPLCGVLLLDDRAIHLTSHQPQNLQFSKSENLDTMKRVGNQELLCPIAYQPDERWKCIIFLPGPPTTHSKHHQGYSIFCSRGLRTIVQPSFHCLRSLENSHTRVS